MIAIVLVAPGGLSGTQNVPEQPTSESEGPWSFDEVLERELAYINRRRAALGLVSASSTGETTALCLSGGGVRSASFCLGVVRALARKGVLKNFDYLSTVSGGGFTGGFLSRWVKEEGYRHVEERLRDDLEFANPQSPLAHVRKYISYLTPRIGLFSLDSISGAGLFIRNLFVNWLIIIPTLMAGLAVVLLGQSGFQWLAILEDARLAFSAFMLAGVTLCGYAISYALFRRPGLSGNLEDLPFQRLTFNYSWPIFFGSMSISAAVVAVKTSERAYPTLNLIIAVLCILLLALAHVMTSTGRRAGQSLWRTLWQALVTLWPLVVQCVAFIGFGVLVLQWIAGWFQPARDASSYGPQPLAVDAEGLANIYYIFGPLVFTLTLYLSEVIYVAFRGNPPSANYEREWLARSTGSLFGVPLAWAFLAFSVIKGPELTFDLIGKVLGFGTGSALGDVFGATTLSGIVVALLTRRKDAVALVKQGYESWMQFGSRWALSLALPLFIFLLIVLLTAAVRLIAYFQFEGLNVAYALSCIAVWLAALGLFFDLMIPTNVFTLHSIYRNRLVRSFVGAANPDRTQGKQETGFLNFFLSDNVRLYELAATALPGGVPPQLHVVNMALNVPGSADIALQERKALPFTASAIAVGSRALPHADPAATAIPPPMRLGSYRPAELYASKDRLPLLATDAEEKSPLSLGSAIAISGAAVSPNMGYHSNSALSVLLTLFNLRLGAWFGNPGTPGNYSFKEDGPGLNIITLFNEAVGRANERRKFVHLSDGGHFDNLGLYEMLARRCKLIIAVDAGCDPTTGLADLGIAQRLAKLDLGAEVTFAEGAMKEVRDSRSRVAVGNIKYAAAGRRPAGKGVIVYIKPRVLDNDSAIISSYGSKSRDFPHEPTSDQWFTESQFAAYLALGESAGAAIPDDALKTMPKPRRRAKPKRRRR